MSVLQMTADITAAYLETNKLAADEIPALLRAVHDALTTLGEPEPAVAAPVAVTPAQVRRSIRPDGLVSFIDGRSYKMLKRHLATHGMTPGDYRARFNLPTDYPMTAPDYSAARSELAKASGLGQQGRQSKPAPAPRKRKT